MEKKGTVLYIGGFELPDKNAAAHRVLSNAKLFREFGFKTVFLGVDRSIAESSKGTLEKKEFQGFEYWTQSYPQTFREWLHYLISIRFFLNTLKHYQDVKLVICYNYQAPAFYKLFRFCRKNGIKIIADCTEWYGAQGETLIKKLFKGIDSFFRMRIIQKNLDGIIVISSYLQNYYKSYYKAKGSIALLPPLVDLSEKKWNSPQHSSKTEEQITLFYAGSPGKEKDKINKIIHSVAALKSEHSVFFRCIGITLEQYLRLYPEDVQLLKDLSDRIIFIKHLTHVECISHLSSSDFSIFFRDDNLVTRAGFPTKLVESISCGIPVITNDTSDIKKYIQSGKNGFILGSNVKEDLSLIFSEPKNNLNSMKATVDRSLFDFKRYAKEFETFLETI